MQTILMLYRVCANYTGCNMKKKILSLIHTLVILNSHMCRSKQIGISSPRHTTLKIKTGTVDSMFTW